MAKPSITTRAAKAAALTYTELDNNFINLRDATLTVTADSGSITNDLNGTFTIAGGTALTSSIAGSTVTINLDNTAVTPNTYTNATVTVDAQGRITAASSGTGGGGFGVITDVVVGSPQGTVDPGENINLIGGTGIQTTLSGSGSANNVTFDLENTAVTPGSYTNADITVDAQGRITSVANGSATGISVPVNNGSSSETFSIAIGTNALNSRTGGSGSNVAVGYNSLTALSTGANNTVVGSQAGTSITTGSKNTIIGSPAGCGSTASDNVLIGYGAQCATGADGNVHIGNFVGTNDANTSAHTGDNNTIIGNNAGRLTNVLSGSNNLILGYNAEPSSATVSNEITLGDANVTKLRIPSLGFSIDSTSITTAATTGTPSNTSTPASWLKITVGVTVYYLPLYS